MKKTTLSMVSILALSGLGFAGGDIAPIETIIETQMVMEQNPFYIGLGIGYAQLNDDFTNEEISSNNIMLQSGYKYNEYVALEGRYTFGFNTDYDRGNLFNSLSGGYDGDVSNWGIYVKPMYPIGNFNIYALLGYGGVMLDDLAGGDAYEDGFQWGLGADYAVNENFSVFVDYVKLYDDTGFDYRAKNDDVDSNTWTLGVSYRF
jgi:opacity protein-like surface antigen